MTPGLEGIQRRASLRRWTTLKAGGPAEMLFVARTRDELIRIVQGAHEMRIPLTLLGWGSNVLPSDEGVPGLVAVNQAAEVEFRGDEVWADTGVGFQDLCLMAAQRSLSGLEFAVGIPGTLGGALVSNAGAYRKEIGVMVIAVEVVRNGRVSWEPPAILGLQYRDSVLRRPDPPAMVLTRVRLRLASGDQKAIYDLSRENQRQRISKQPPPASAGSFFKNVNDLNLAAGLPALPPALKEKGIVPAGYLIEACGLKGIRWGGAMMHTRHANFMTNVNQATAGEIRRLAEHVKAKVFRRFGVRIEEEVLYLGDWSGWVETGTLGGPET
ncbi:MAG: UDP-N-acetylmuramate dehydrogenase [Fimbriimonadaceae bacterium]|nr:UDP-N-acetylmuramate dehydrogenase [Fimbriimonadaceae bacterium]